MKLNIFTVFDVAAAAYINPFFLPEIAQAERAFTQAALDPDHEFGRAPSDYTLTHIGTFDSQSGKIETFTQPKVLGTAIEYTARVNRAANNMLGSIGDKSKQERKNATEQTHDERPPVEYDS
mgnify:CR=1 FL=1